MQLENLQGVVLINAIGKWKCTVEKKHLWNTCRGGGFEEQKRGTPSTEYIEIIDPSVNCEELCWGDREQSFSVYSTLVLEKPALPSVR